MFPQLINTLSWWQWALLAAVPPAIFALYFLKLRRQPVEVPSTYLWRKSIEDIHVNSIWQRLRRNILLLLQLLLVFVIMLALLRPSWQGATLSGGRYIFLIDNSASMSATDVSPSRLDEAKRLARELIDQMRHGDEAMIVAFSDVAHVHRPYTGNRRELRESVDTIRPTNRGTSLGEALAVAAGSLRAAAEAASDATRDKPPARLILLSDGRFEDVEDFDLAQLDVSEVLMPIFIPIGRPDADNVAITSLGTRRDDGPRGTLRALVRLENFGPRDAVARLELLLDGNLADVKDVAVPGDEDAAEVFDLGELTEGVLHARITQLRDASGGKIDDVMPIDDEAWAVVALPRRARVLLVTPGNFFLEQALATQRSVELADVTVAGPEILSNAEFQRDLAQNLYDLVIYDRCAPVVSDDPTDVLRKMPQANTWFIGRLPPLPQWRAEPHRELLLVVDTDAGHPLMQWLQTDGVVFEGGTPFAKDGIAGGRVLVETNEGPIFAIAPRGGYQDAVLAAEIVGVENGEQFYRTNWWQRQSFPLLISRVLQFLGQAETSAGGISVRPGMPVTLRARTAASELTVTAPDGRRHTVRRNPLDMFPVVRTEQPGVYEAREGNELVERFAVNLFSRSESDVLPRQSGETAEVTIRIGHDEITGSADWRTTRREGWRWLLLAVLAIALVEWYIYNRRVYV